MSHDHSDFVVIGGVAAGPKTAATLARRLPTARITLFQREERISYGTCGMPYFASGDVNSFEELTHTSYGVPRTPSFFKRTKGFDVVTRAEVINIDRTTKTLTVNNLETGETFEHGYGKLVLATGSGPNVPPFPVADSPAIRFFTRPDDAIAFRQMAQTGKIGSALIVGGGFIGCEVAEAAGSLWGIEVTLVEMEPQLLPRVLDPEMAAMVRAELIHQDVTVKTGTRIQGIELDADGNPVAKVKDGDDICVDYVFLCMGVHPEVSLAAKAGLTIGTFGGLVVNKHMQTSDPDIYAGGDCVESTHRLTGKPLYMPMGSLANRHGRVIAENLAGTPACFPEVVGTFLVKVFNANVGTVGLSEQAARRDGLPVASVWGTFPDKPDFYPEGQSVSLKMVYNPETGDLLGLQAIGLGDICRRIDVFATFLHNRATVEDLLDFEHGYAPPYSEALDPLHHLAGMARARKAGMDFLSPGTEIAGLGENVVLLDVRENDEVASEPWHVDRPVINIPLDDLRERAGELDRDREIVIICKRGPRSYQAALILKSAGFSNVRVMGGGVTGLAY